MSSKRSLRLPPASAMACAFRGALLGILFPPIEFYVLYLVYKVFVSDEPLAARYRNMASAAAVIMLVVLGGWYAILRPR